MCWRCACERACVLRMRSARLHILRQVRAGWLAKNWCTRTLEAQPQHRMSAACSIATAAGPAAAATASPPSALPAMAIAAREGPPYIFIHDRSIQSLNFHRYTPCSARRGQAAIGIRRMDP